MRRRLKEFVLSKLIDNFLLFCVFANTIILSLNGIVDEDTD
jgi:hypothetical protein